MVSKVREKIVNAALDCFHEVGFSASSVQDIVDRAGVPKGSFYNYFKAKELLAIEVISLYSAGSGRELLASDAVAPVQRLRNHFEFLAARYAGFGYAKGCLVGNLAAEASENMPLLRQALAESLGKWTQLLSVAIREGQDDGSVVSSLDANRTASFLINSWEGAVVRMKIVASREPLDDFFAIVFPLLIPPVVATKSQTAHRNKARRIAKDHA